MPQLFFVCLETRFYSFFACHSLISCLQCRKAIAQSTNFHFQVKSFFCFRSVLGALIAGIYGLWNIYVFAILILYAPSQTSTDHTVKLVYDDVYDEDTSDTKRFITQSVNNETFLEYSIAGKGSVE